MANEKRIVHVVGTGTIGEPLTGLLADLSTPLGIDAVTFHKRSPRVTDRPKLSNLTRKGAKLAADPSAMDEFAKIGFKPELTQEEAINQASVVIDCTPSGVGNKNRIETYERYLENTKGFLAQGSEFGFGKMYARGINDSVLVPGEDRFLQVVSCNTHNISVLLKALGVEGEDNLGIDKATFLCLRRANDISQDGSFVPSPQVGKHGDERFGTHHARDAHMLFQTMGMELDLFSSAVKLPTQYMHALWFDISLAHSISLEDVKDRFEKNPRIALTQKTSANSVFSFGREQGYYGRILNVAVVSTPTLTVQNDGHRVVGFCFTPQDGNSLLSSVAGALWMLDPATVSERMQVLRPYMFDEV